jgi:aspartyl-tRNA(Asn)/glutamyl-tRNA(Gln) amidotransferase subunit B
MRTSPNQWVLSATSDLSVERPERSSPIIADYCPPLGSLARSGASSLTLRSRIRSAISTSLDIPGDTTRMNAPTKAYKIVVGLEVHVQLKTETKLFCRCSTEFGAPPNTQVCPVCLGLPGALPVLNAKAVELAVRAGVALNCGIGPFTKWDRKNYFYPDLPKGYQTSQFDLPICVGGSLEIDAVDEVTGEPCRKRISLVRAHLEEDAGKSLHDEVAGRADTRIDLNRAGTPLLEIVSQPELSSAEEAKNYLTEMRLLMMFLGVTDGNMQEGSLRADANVNLHFDRNGKTIATPIVEIKNLNSFRAVERAVNFEVARQFDAFMETGLAMGQSPKTTRGWNDATGETEMQREKEDSADYRYFPCPDLVPVVLSDDDVERARLLALKTPSSVRKVLIETHSVKPNEVEILLQQGRSVTEYFESMIANGASSKRSVAWMLQDVLRNLNENRIAIESFPIKAETLAKLLVAIETGKLDTARGREAFAKMIAEPGLSVEKAIDSLGIQTINAGEIESLCKQLLEENPDVIEKFRAGNLKAIAALVGPAKKKNKNVDPRQVQEICQRMIESGAF